LKRREEGKAVVLRLQETRGRPTHVGLDSATPIASVRELDGCERSIGDTLPTAEALPLRFRPFELRTVALRPAPPRLAAVKPESHPLVLSCDRRATSLHGGAAADLDGRGRSFPGEQWPAAVTVGPARLVLGPARSEAANALDCRGQTVSWAGSGERLVLLLAADTDADVWIEVGVRPMQVSVPCWTGPIGRWKGRRRGLKHERWDRPGTGFCKPARIAWVATHRHRRQAEDEPYESCYLFAFEIDLQPEDSAFTLPDAPAVHLFAASVIRGALPRLRPVSPWLNDIELS
jgi:alpha-mannosidase